MTLYIAFVSVLNIAIGFGLALYLRRAQMSGSQDQVSGSGATQSFGSAAEQSGSNESEALSTDVPAEPETDQMQQDDSSELLSADAVEPTAVEVAADSSSTDEPRCEVSPTDDSPAEEPAAMIEDLAASGLTEQQDAAETASLSGEMATDAAVEPGAADIEGPLEQGLRKFQDQLEEQTELSTLHAVETDPGYPATPEAAGVAPSATIEQQDGQVSAEAEVLAGVDVFRSQLADAQNRALQDSSSETASL